VSLRLSGGLKLQSPVGQTARPTTSRVRLAVMNLLTAELPGCRWLDLCCGSGVMGCEALQRGARRVVAVDHDRRMLSTARRNLEAVQVGLTSPCQVRVVRAPLPSWLERPPAQQLGEEEAGGFDLIYLDPPYGSGLYVPIATAVAAGGWLASGGRMIWECSSACFPEPPSGWDVADRRRYGSCGLMVLTASR
jgi:16S rRNA (guanine(966)-N(2))-methyltransferase RsmD